MTTALSNLLASILERRPELTAEQAAPMIGECSTHGPHVRGSNVRGVWVTGCPDCHLAEQVKRNLVKACIPVRFSDAAFDNWEPEGSRQREAKRSVVDWLAAECSNTSCGASLALLGRPGTGKTHLGIAAIRESIVRYHLRARYTTVREIIRAVRDTWRRDSEQSEGEVIDIIAGFDLLVIDEVGVQAGTENERTILFDVVDERYRNMKPTLFISNESRAGLQSFLGERIIDRMREGGGRMIPMEWESRRAAATSRIRGEIEPRDGGGDVSDVACEVRHG